MEAQFRPRIGLVRRTRLRRVGQRALAAIGAGLLLATLAVTATPGVAQAATCSGTSEQVVKPVGTIDLTWAVCSDSSLQIWSGTVHDTLCDNRESGVELWEYFEKAGTTTWKEMGHSKDYWADGGCGNYSSFPRVTFARQSDSAGTDCSTCEHQLEVEVFACSGGGLNCSSDYFSHYYFYYPGGGGGGCAAPLRAPAASRHGRTPGVIPC